MAGRFEIYKDVGGQYRFRLEGRNGEIVAAGESYPTKAAVKNCRKVVEVRTASHVVMMSHPKITADLIEAAAKATC